ncbi:Protein RecA [Capsicum chinense]|nr:Protein RecA [Capsicum chinense]
MELLLSLPVKAQFFGAKICYNSPSYSTSVKLCHKVSRAQISARGIRVRSEFDQKINGAFSPDSDARFLDRQKALEAAMNDINSSFGKGSVTRLGSAGGALVETFPSGCLTLDFALGGGLPKGRIVEIYGPESSGKTTLALHAIAEVQVQCVLVYCILQFGTSIGIGVHLEGRGELII